MHKHCFNFFCIINLFLLEYVVKYRHGKVRDL